MAKISKRTVDVLEPRDREHVLWDDELRGFGVRRPSGRKTYIVSSGFERATFPAQTLRRE